MTGLALDLRAALRSFRNTPGLFLVALVTIALGVGGNTAMFSVLNAVVLRPLPYAAPERLVALWPEKRWSLDMLDDVEARVGSYASVGAYRAVTYTLLGDGEPEAVPVAIVTPGYLATLGVRVVAGRDFSANDASGDGGAVVLLSHGLWQRRFGGDPAVVGRTVRLAGGDVESRTVVGILPRDFTPHPATAEAWVPVVRTPDRPGYWQGYGMSVVGRLRPGAAAGPASAELRRLVAELTPEHPSQFREARYSPVDVVPLLELLTRDVRTRLVVLLGAVGFILLIACTNVANLLLARARGRQREVAIQVAIGCPPRRIVRQVLVESLVLGLAGGVAGVTAAVLALPLLRGFVEPFVPRSASIALDATVLGFAVLVSVVAGLVFGALPALQAARTAPGDVMRATAGRGQSQGRASGRANDLLVVAEVALSLVLLAGSGLMLKSLWQLTRVDPGFDAAQVLTLQVTVPPGRYDSADARAALLRQLEARVGGLPGVEALGAIDYLPLAGTGVGIPYRVEGQDEGEGGRQVVNRRLVTPGYFETLGIPLARGRTFGPDDVPAADEGSLLVNEAFVRQHWPGADPIGRRVLASTGDGVIGRIVGVVADVRQASVREAPEPEIYGTVAQWGWPGGSLVVRGARATPAAATVAGALRAVEPDLAVRDVRPMEAVVRESLADARFYTRLLTGFALLALTLGLVGVYGVMSYAVSRRTRELGVRLAFGATRRDLLRTVMARAMAPVGAGVLLGVVAALALTRVLAGFLFEVGAADPWVLGGTVLLLSAAAAGAAFVPAMRASRTAPGIVLRAE